MVTKSSRHLMIERECEWCHKSFMARKQRVDEGLGRFCSRECAHNRQSETAKELYGFEKGKKYWEGNRWVVRWYDDKGKVHVTTYQNWWWQTNRGEIPEGYCISYVDGNQENIDPSNFECIIKSKAIGKGGRKQKGIPKSDVARQHMSESGKVKVFSDIHKQHMSETLKARWKRGDFDNVQFIDIRGDKNPGWRGGAGQEYPEEFNRALKKFIWERDRHVCQICGRKVSPKDLVGHVHHINGNKEDNDYDNLILLCIHCHARIHKTEDVSSPVIMAFRSRLEWNQSLLSK